MDGATLGLAGAARVFRIDQTVEHLRRGNVAKTTNDTRYGASSLYPAEADPERLVNDNDLSFHISARKLSIAEGANMPNLVGDGGPVAEAHRTERLAAKPIGSRVS